MIATLAALVVSAYAHEDKQEHWQLVNANGVSKNDVFDLCYRANVQDGGLAIVPVKTGQGNAGTQFSDGPAQQDVAGELPSGEEYIQFRSQGRGFVSGDGHLQDENGNALGVVICSKSNDVSSVSLSWAEDSNKVSSANSVSVNIKKNGVSYIPATQIKEPAVVGVLSN